MKFECPFCGQWYECEPGFGEAICQKCNHTIFEKNILKKTTRLISCPICGGKRSTTAFMCPHCGDQFSITRKPKSLKNGLILLGAFVLYCVLGVLCGLFEYAVTEDKHNNLWPLFFLVFMPFFLWIAFSLYFFMPADIVDKGDE